MREALIKILVESTKQDYEKISQDTDRDYIMTAQMAKEYGIIDEVIEKRS
jgi:ATP-dependent Clp protease protease subunit